MMPHPCLGTAPATVRHDGETTPRSSTAGRARAIQQSNNEAPQNHLTGDVHMQHTCAPKLLQPCQIRRCAMQTPGLCLAQSRCQSFNELMHTSNPSDLPCSCAHACSFFLSGTMTATSDDFSESPCTQIWSTTPTFLNVFSNFSTATYSPCASLNKFFCSSCKRVSSGTPVQRSL